MSKLLEGQELEKRCRELAVDIQGPARDKSVSGASARAPDYELQRRLNEAERGIRESRLWWIAVISAVASVLSAAVVLWAVLRISR
jgi:hypothetical protein